MKKPARGEQIPENAMDRVQRRIARGGRFLMHVCNIVKIFLVIAMILNGGLLIAVFFSTGAQKIAQQSFEHNALYQALIVFADLSELDPRYSSAIGCFTLLITLGVLFLFARSSEEMFRRLAEGGRPFDIETSRKMRYLAWAMLLMMVYSVPLGLIAFFILMLFSYIMEYGGYIQEQADETNRIQEEMIVSFAEITENKSGQTGKHIKRVSEYSKILARQMGLSPEAVEDIRIASTMHDIGKLMIPAEILEKPGKLTPEEYEIIKRHTTYGGELLENVEGDEMALSRTIALEHHERVDGRGYPAQLSGDSISLEGRIVAVADVYDALTSRRSYKDAWTEEDAAQEIVRGSGTQFDARVVEAFQQAHDKILEVQQKYRDD